MPDVASGRIGPPHYHDTFQTCQTSLVAQCVLPRCARATRRTHTHHTRVEMHLVCLGVWRVVFWPSWCLVHHTTMKPFKRARRGEWAYACWRDVHVPHVARTLTTHETSCHLTREVRSIPSCREEDCGVGLGGWWGVFWDMLGF